MKKQKLIPAIMLSLYLLVSASTAFATVPFPQSPVDLPPGTMNYGTIDKGTLPLDPNIMAAVIGVSGLLIGSIITILATYFMRWMDVRREDRREDLLIERSKREKEFQLKQDTYKAFLNELADLEAVHVKDLDSFKKAWTRTEIALDLVASPEVRQAKDAVQSELMATAEKSFKTGAVELSPDYLKNRDSLLQAIREDIDIFKSE